MLVLVPGPISGLDLIPTLLTPFPKDQRDSILRAVPTPVSQTGLEPRRSESLGDVPRDPDGGFCSSLNLVISGKEPHRDSGLSGTRVRDQRQTADETDLMLRIQRPIGLCIQRRSLAHATPPICSQRVTVLPPPNSDLFAYTV